jgi:hypothetical protein
MSLTASEGTGCARRNRRHHRRRITAVSLAAQNQRLVCLESLSKKFKKDVTDQSGRHGNSKIGSGKNISDGPSYAPLLAHTRALKFSHQEIGIKQEHDKPNLDHRSPGILLHGKNRVEIVAESLMKSAELH